MYLFRERLSPRKDVRHGRPRPPEAIHAHDPREHHQRDEGFGVDGPEHLGAAVPHHTRQGLG